ncbi:helix-turn-helix domain-containing protein [Phenylobacterium aquaticum]|uniref:winged helix-turn-helix transcriptional regulator n=1 Tax=Phenylobacterium aquaticum TaxID=1763816 RepID=UPI0026E9F0DD|nr:helix-turn-helix domain-containing protein [Phenylobacterium aquaticum]
MKTVAPIPGRPVRGSSTGRPIMAALDLFGRRGLLRILWELRGEAPLTFRALASAAELPPGTLNVRLKELKAAGLLVTEAGYGLTPMGRDLLAALEPLVLWSEAWAKAVPPADA